MIRKRLAALILTAGFGFLGGCTTYASVGCPDGNGGGLFSRLCNGRNGGRFAAFPTSCCPGGCELSDTGSTVFLQNGGIGVVAVPELGGMPPAAIPGLPPAAAPTYPPPSLNEPPLGTGTKFSPVPKATPVPYIPMAH
jgi:hypothetical protein